MQRLIQTAGVIAMTTFYASPSASAEVKAVNPTALYDPSPNGYSHIVVVELSGRLAFIAGQGGERGDGSLSPDFEAQVAQAYKNLASALDALEADPSRVVRLNTYVVGHEQWKLDILTRHLVAMFGDHLPAQTLVPVPRLALDGMLFEVDATVALNAKAAGR